MKTPFLTPDDHILLMDMYSNPLTLDELHMLEDAGIKTIYAQGMTRWERIMPTLFGPLEWSYLDDYVNKISKTGMKLLLPNINLMPMCKPDDWFYSREVSGTPNYRNPQVALDVDDIDELMIARYGNSRVQIIYTIVCNGEFIEGIFPKDTQIFPNEIIVPFIRDRFVLLEKQFGEVWTSFHHIGNPPYLEPTLQALQKDFPDSRHYSIQFTYFNQPPAVGMVSMVGEAQKKYGIRYFVGSEYCEGLRDNTDFAIQHNLEFLTAPTHPFNGHLRLEPYMLEYIRGSLAKYNAVKTV